MNKAFVREPDDVEPRCPQCGTPGEKVSRDTLLAHLQPSAVDILGTSAFWCPTSTCDVAYFDGMEQRTTIANLKQPLYPKDPRANLCPCFGFTLDDIDEDIADGVPRRIRELLAKSKTAAAHCPTASANGKCCIPEVQRQYFRRKAERDAGQG